MVRVRVPATSANLGPGLDALGLAVDLHTTVELDEAEGGVEIEFSGLGQGEVSLGEDNLVYRSARRIWELVGYHPPGIRMRVENRIPLARGLGSSAAAIVGGMVAANALAATRRGGEAALGEAELLAAAAGVEGHPDNVAPALLGGIIVAVQTGEGISYLRFLPPARIRVIVAIPEFPLATEKARQCIPRTVPVADAVFNLGRSALLVGALMQGRWDLLGHACEDRLHQPYRANLVPGLEDVIAAALEAGARGAVLSGAGPSVLAIVEEGAPSAAPAVARAMSEAFLDAGVDCRTLVAGLAEQGATLEG